MERVSTKSERARKKAVDRLFDRAKFHTHAGVYMARSWSMETILVSICLKHGKITEEILGKLKGRINRPYYLFFGDTREKGSGLVC